ncbi:conserved hypothetical protein [Neospora caninum Liverpool]|uniref:Uncharacterized protein n=1 Tax=Neospora caninum (strain Liverpool) TaxID=572307 RepID=F0VDW8_NEOCL|nr:conserved hypothetical protein [Neospora caninum Liverpool]CBZ51911.1 conserved hypothetical protein [Neospora caninum Liverpool]CEL65873.1 TPA: hypothetical protein BN1204_017030 [Neospora caninum Liverpool]|eukprot:XP_003881944.1 conserved hypothetical protein [Neospora caninum Liverpool]
MGDLDSNLEESLRRLIIGTRFPDQEQCGSSMPSDFTPAPPRLFDNAPGPCNAYFPAPGNPPLPDRVSPKNAVPPQPPPTNHGSFPRIPEPPFGDFFSGLPSFPSDLTALCVGAGHHVLSAPSAPPKHDCDGSSVGRCEPAESAGDKHSVDRTRLPSLKKGSDRPRSNGAYPASAPDSRQHAYLPEQKAPTEGSPTASCSSKSQPAPPPSAMLNNSGATRTPGPPPSLALPPEIMNSGRDACVLVTLPLCLPYGKILNVCGESETSCCKRNYYCISPKLNYAAWKLFAHSGGICDTYAAALHVEVAIIHVPEPLLPQVADLFMKHAAQADFHFDSPLQLKCGNLQERPAPVRAGGKVLTLECFFGDQQERKKLAAIEHFLSCFRTELEYLISAHRPHRSGHSGRKPNIWRLSRNQPGWRNGGHHRGPRLDVTVRAFQQQGSQPATAGSGIQEANGLVADVCASEIRLVTTRSYGQLTTKADPRFAESKVGTRCLLRAQRTTGSKTGFTVPCRKVFAPQQVPEVLPLVFRPGSLISQEQQRACVEWEVTHRMEKEAVAPRRADPPSAPLSSLPAGKAHHSGAPGAGLSLPAVSLPGLSIEGDLGSVRGCEDSDVCLSLYGRSPAGDSSSTRESGGSLSPPASHGREGSTPGSSKQSDPPVTLLSRLGYVPWRGGDLGSESRVVAPHDLAKDDLLLNASADSAAAQALDLGAWPAPAASTALPRSAEQSGNFPTPDGARLPVQSQDLWVFLPALLDALRAGRDVGREAGVPEAEKDLGVGGDERREDWSGRGRHRGSVGSCHSQGSTGMGALSDRSAASAFPYVFDGFGPAARSVGMEMQSGMVPGSQAVPPRRDVFSSSHDALNEFLLSLTSTPSSADSHS